MTLAEHKRMDF
jgi:hypothetical protein